MLRTKLGEVAPDTNEEVLRVVAAVGSAAACGVLSHPFDTAKTCMQGDVEQVTYSSMRETFSKISKNGGVSALYRGIEFRFLRQVWQVWVLDLMREKLASALFPAFSVTPGVKLDLSDDTAGSHLPSCQASE